MLAILDDNGAKIVGHLVVVEQHQCGYSGREGRRFGRYGRPNQCDCHNNAAPASSQQRTRKSASLKGRPWNFWRLRVG